MADSISQEIFLRSISHAHYRNRVGAHNSAEAIKLLNAIYAESRGILVGNIEILRESFDADTTPTNARFRAQLRDVILNISEVRQEPFADTLSFIDQDLKEFSEYESEFTLNNIFNNSADEVLSGTPFTLAFQGISSAQLYAATMQTQVALGSGMNGTLTSLLSGVPKSEQRRMFRRIETGFVQGHTNQDIIRSVFNRQSKSAEETKTRNAIDAIVRTSTNSMGNQAHKLISEENEDLIKGYRNLATWDSRISSICASIALKFGDKVLPYNAFPPIPRHLRCRSLIESVLKSWNEVLKTGKVLIDTDQGTQAFFAGPTKESSGQLTKRLLRQGMTKSQIDKFKRGISGQSSETTLSGFLGEQRKRGNTKFLNTFFNSKERAKLYIDGRFKASELYDMESRKPIPLAKLIEIES